MRAVLRTSWVWIALASGACSSDDDTIEERHGFADADGRVCQATVEKARADAPVLSVAVECEGGSRTCSSDARSCFQLDVAPETFEILNCPACCRGAASSFFAVDCSPVTCRTAADCVYESASCTAGVCVCATGACD